jgi:hypothetical protein
MAKTGYTREYLESLKRTDLQRLCKVTHISTVRRGEAVQLIRLSKGFGLKANLKSEALINLVLGQPPPPDMCVS